MLSGTILIAAMLGGLGITITAIVIRFSRVMRSHVWSVCGLTIMGISAWGAWIGGKDWMFDNQSRRECEARASRSFVLAVVDTGRGRRDYYMIDPCPEGKQPGPEASHVQRGVVDLNQFEGQWNVRWMWRETSLGVRVMCLSGVFIGCPVGAAMIVNGVRAGRRS